MADDGNGNGNGKFNQRLSTVLSWMALFISIGIQAGVLLTKVNTLSDEVRELKISAETVKIQQLQDGYTLNAMKHRLGWLEKRYSDVMIKRR